MKSFDRDSISDFRAVLTLALKRVQKETGVQCSIGTIRYSPSEARMKLIAALPVSGSKTVDNINVRAFKLYAESLYGIARDALGQRFVDRGIQYIVMGLKPRSHKYPILVQRCKDGRSFKMKASSVAIHFPVRLTH